MWALSTRAFGAFGQLLRLLVELVELGQVETGKVVDTGVRAVEKRHEAEALGCRVDLAQEPHLQLARACHLEQIGPLLNEEFDTDADRVQATLPQFHILACQRGRVRGHHDLERLAVGHFAPAVSVAVYITEPVE